MSEAHMTTTKKRRSGLARLHDLVTSRTKGKSAARQWAEMAALFALRGNGPGFYQMGGFWRSGYRWTDMARHMSFREYKGHIDTLNPRDYRKLSQNKIAEKAILTMMGIPTPRFLGLLDPASGRTVSGAPLKSAADLERLIAGDRAAALCFKEVEGHGGRGFVAADVERSPQLRFRLRTHDGRVVTPEELLGVLGSGARVIEVYLDQHPTYAAFNPTSVNTLRIWVLRRNGVVSTKLAFLRIGRRGSLVDNRSAGGIVAPVDVGNGRLSAALDGKPSRQEYASHPDSGARIEGVELPLWDEVNRVAQEALGVFPYMNFAGIDVAVGHEGPVVIEANVQADRSGAVHVGIPTKDVFGID
jgi:hypothetical protein